MANLSFPELKETRGNVLPSASEDTLKQLREEMCSQSASRDFKLQNYQRFLRRVLSPDSPTRCLLMVHGTGTGKTCTAIQIAEEYIIRPEFQDKRVLVLANPAVQDNFKTQIFAMSKVSVDPDGILLSKQCTGRRYLDMLLRIQSEPLKWTDKATRERMNTIAQRIISEFYEFQGYKTFANLINEQDSLGDAWIHKTFDNRLIIIDEAHSIRNPEDGMPTKLISMALDRVIKTANNVTLILLTATPMFDSYDEMIFYFNLFLWNERKQPLTTQLLPSKVFTKSGNFQPGMEEKFRGWCQDYVSFIRGDNPLTFPFRLPPPANMIAQPATLDLIKNKPIHIKERRSVLTLTASFVQGIQAEVLKSHKDLKLGFASSGPTICVLPKNGTFRTTFKKSQDEDSEFEYTDKFLAPSRVADHSSKFALITKLIKQSKGVIFVYSNLVEMGAQLFAMCLEEHGYESALGTKLLKTTANEVERGSMGKYILFTSELSNTAEGRRALERLKNIENKDGNDIKVIIASPAISEGVDLSYIRQVHVIEYCWNMSKIEQVVGRGIRTCSHQALPFEEQNCTVYLHVCKLENSERELIDEFYYRTAVEAKARLIANVKHVVMESAMDCPLQTDINSLPKEWRELRIEQNRSQDGKPVTLSLGEMAAPTFGPIDFSCKVKESTPDPEHERPLSAYIDVRDELLDKFMKLFLRKPVWTIDDLYASPQLRMYDRDVILYTLHNAIETGFQIKDRNGRMGFIESKGSMYAFTLGDFNAMQDRYIKEDKGKQTRLEVKAVEEKEESTLEEKRKQLKIPAGIKSRFNKQVIDWYIVDQEMTEAERIQHMLSLDWKNPPIYAKLLKVSDMRILGSKKIYNEQNELITPIGKQADAYYKWVKQRIDLFLETRTKFLAAVQSGRLVFNLDDKSDELKRAERSKVIKGRACGSYLEPLLHKFAIWLGYPIPETVKTKTDRCQYLALAVRQVVLDGSKDIMWWTPEEWDIFDEDNNRKEMISKLKS